MFSAQQMKKIYILGLKLETFLNMITSKQTTNKTETSHML